mmetsp:Transcript_11690/g.14576  ORF Transcript_11690/g.14576 Transcript_11690/m.14576 type:complete len:140 (+) Transcript_11690:47-466(+)|eukprot:CAMPEP_0204828086 /NCGR_PEP_ID=MMETSP1346-20131115/5698_1 /ASSEMBLY_ACC=CAM_ASM_000771 /TAXON_ID=215587 /ORGANISM="Aplanochytrium stocchinoi, Strain GSBS06" /LENGTH=139 /DNA_ID=CAMNT_0051956887 /DNA_START=37 /DNA_END=456 /DNA_ORIENTATION=-
MGLTAKTAAMSSAYGLAAWGVGAVILHNLAEPLSEEGAGIALTGALGLLVPAITVVTHEVLGFVLGIPADSPEILPPIMMAFATACLVDSINILAFPRGGAYNVHLEGVRIVGGSLLMAVGQGFLYALWRTSCAKKKEN